MDWGLAKVLKEGGIADEKTPQPTDVSVIQTARSGSDAAGKPGSQTQAGQVMGTPSYMAHYVLGNALRDQGQLKEAEVAYRDALRLKPDSAEAHFDLGNILCSQDRHKEAEAAFREVVRLDPDYPEAHCNLGLTAGPREMPCAGGQRL
jgi:Flp pilus assembly protein TadD